MRKQAKAYVHLKFITIFGFCLKVNNFEFKFTSETFATSVTHSEELVQFTELVQLTQKVISGIM